MTDWATITCYFQSHFIIGHGTIVQACEQSANISGEVIDSLTLNLIEGWNLISGITYTITLDSIDDPEDLIVPGTLFIYDGNYTDTETIEPGHGYWLRSNGTGQIILNYSE